MHCMIKDTVKGFEHVYDALRLRVRLWKEDVIEWQQRKKK